MRGPAQVRPGQQWRLTAPTRRPHCGHYIVHGVEQVYVEAVRRVPMLVPIRYNNAVYYSCSLTKMHQVVDLLARITQPQSTAISTPSVFSSSHTGTGYSESYQNYNCKASYHVYMFSNHKKVS